MPLLSVVEAALQKGCSGQAIRDAINGGKISGQQVGRAYVVKVDKHFEEWTPNPKRIAGATRGTRERKRKAAS